MQTQLIEESLTQEALVQSLNAQDQMVRSFKDVNGKYADYSQGAIFYSSAVNPATRFVNSLIYALMQVLVPIESCRVCFHSGTIDYLPKLCHSVYETF